MAVHEAGWLARHCVMQAAAKAGTAQGLFSHFFNLCGEIGATA
jgi:hypothetical protein